MLSSSGPLQKIKTMKTIMNNWLVLLAAAFLLAFSSCSGNAVKASDSPDHTAAAVTNEEASGQSSVVDDVSQKDIVKVAVGSPDHTTLVAAVKAADLVNALSNAGPFTVFAPTNAAFSALPAGTVDDLLKPENKGKLEDILQYHVTVSVYEAERLTDGMVLGQVNGGNVTISNKDGKLMVNDANIIASVRASNGVIHIIDKVLLPK
jgi:uncharacterized surface protein with fasciclin (FAS1) repeats